MLVINIYIHLELPRLLSVYCCGASVASEQQHKQDLRRIYKREYEFSKSSLFTRMLCAFLPECIAPFYQNVLRKHDEERASFAAQTQSFLCGKFSTARLEVLTNLRHAGVFQMSTMVILGIGFQIKRLWLVQALNLTRRWAFALRPRNTGDIQIPAC